jgi:hypothetical protein
LLGLKVVLLKNICFSKRKRFSQEQIEVLPKGRGLPIILKKFRNKNLTEKYRGFIKMQKFSQVVEKVS